MSPGVVQRRSSALAFRFNARRLWLGDVYRASSMVKTTRAARLMCGKTARAGNS